MGILCVGNFQVKADYGNLLVEYREHDSRNGKLLINVDGSPLSSVQLRKIVQFLEKEEEKLRIGRERFGGYGVKSNAKILEDYDAETIIELGEILAFQIKKSGKDKTSKLELYKYKELYFFIEDNYAEEYEESMDAILESRIAMKTEETVSIWLSDEFEYLK